MARLLAVTAVVLVASLAPASAHGGIVGQGGKRGKSTIYRGDCKYGNNGLRGFLTTSAPSPSVTGANLRRRRKDYTYVRFAVWLRDASGGGVLQASSWSSWIRVSDRSGLRTWRGGTEFPPHDWRGNYRLEIGIEWWTSRRRVGWRNAVLTSYNFYDQYNVGPFGPLASCHHTQVEY
jgi:hypothetical protein